MDYSVFLLIFIVKVHSETIPFKGVHENELAQTSLSLIKTYVNRVQERVMEEELTVQDMKLHDLKDKRLVGILGDGLLNEYDMNKILWIIVRKKNPNIKKNHGIHRPTAQDNLPPRNAITNDISRDYRRRSWRGSCYNRKSNRCRRACLQAFRYICMDYSCTSRIRRDARRQCTRSCRNARSYGSRSSSSESE